ncbi:hypothetical protein Q8A67_023153 [Cirrhinus molitorella]|uniref:LBH domain-containing protein n=1 Tax=Cirrhinus molitorella TaxID=172907 RepID=A0AA88NZG9_9TELE|nr:hypothetical protein Q8A67_023153 [Cirrhinus molitorella]
MSVCESVCLPCAGEGQNTDRQTGEKQTSGGRWTNAEETDTEQQQLDLHSQSYMHQLRSPQDSSVEQHRLQRRGENASYQIFPEPEQLEPLQVKGGAARLKERLPSIVVEPSEESEEESGELQWPPLNTQTSIDQEEEEEEDPFQEHCELNSGGQEQQTDADRVLHFKRSSIPCIQIDYSRLTPPPSPTSSHAAPPRFRS